MKKFFQLFLSVVISISFCLCLFGCSSNSSSKSSDKTQYFVEMAPSDRSIQYYLVNNPEKFARGERFTTDDLTPSLRLLLTPGGNIKGIDVNEGGYSKVLSYQCVPDVEGWYCVTCWYLNKWTGEETHITVYTRESI